MSGKRSTPRRLAKSSPITTSPKRISLPRTIHVLLIGGGKSLRSLRACVNMTNEVGMRPSRCYLGAKGPQSRTARGTAHPFFWARLGIYIGESCILDIARDISFYVDWKSVHASPSSIARQLLRSAFYVLFLHEQFHHKVESLGLRYLIATGTDHYRPYKANVYRPLYLSSGCLEESLANAESYGRPMKYATPAARTRRFVLVYDVFWKCLSDRSRQAMRKQ